MLVLHNTGTDPIQVGSVVVPPGEFRRVLPNDVRNISAKIPSGKYRLERKAHIRYVPPPPETVGKGILDQAFVREDLEAHKTKAELRQIAESLSLVVTSSMTKSDIINLLVKDVVDRVENG